MVNLQLFGRKKDRETQKAERWLKERRVAYSFVDVDMKPPSRSESQSIAQAAGGHEHLVDTQGAAFAKGGWAHRVFDPQTELEEHPELLKTPILRQGPRAVVGFLEADWKTLVGGR